MAPAFFSVFLTLLGSSTQPAIRPHPLRLSDGGLTFDRVVRTEEPSTPDPGFHVVDELRHSDPAVILVGDADHDRRQEIVTEYYPVPSDPGVPSLLFYEDDGTGRFDEVHAIEPGWPVALGDVDGDGLTDLFFERGLDYCHVEIVRMEASSHFGFPDHVVWTAQQQGAASAGATIADVDGDGVLELVISRNTFFCGPPMLKVFESAPGDQMKLIFTQQFASDLGNPVVADFDLDGRNEIVMAEGNGERVHVLEGSADDTIVYSGFVPHPMSNAYGLALIDAFSPDNRPIVFLAGMTFELGGSTKYWVYSYEMLADNALSQVNVTQVPNTSGIGAPKIAAADLFGTSTAEIFVNAVNVNGPGNPLAIYSVVPSKIGGALVLFDLPVIPYSYEVAGTRQTRVHSGALVVGTQPNDSNPQGHTLVLERRSP